MIIIDTNFFCPIGKPFYSLANLVFGIHGCFRHFCNFFLVLVKHRRAIFSMTWRNVK
jgi:hypothetical protein